MRKTALIWRRFLFDDVGDVLWGASPLPVIEKNSQFLCTFNIYLLLKAKYPSSGLLGDGFFLFTGIQSRGI